MNINKYMTVFVNNDDFSEFMEKKECRKCPLTALEEHNISSIIEQDILLN